MMADAAFTLDLLGSADLRDAAGRPVGRVLAQPKRFALLAYLALQGEQFTRRAALLDLFWPDVPDDRARNSLSQSLHHLREHLTGDLIELRGAEELRLRPGCVRCDAVAARADADAGRHEAAVVGWKGDLLAEFRPDIGRGFDRWLEDERSGLRQRLTRSALAAASRATIEGAPERAWDLLLRAQAASPLDDGLMQALLGAALAAGHRVEALARYERFRVELAPLELEPAPETAAAAAALRADGEQAESVSPWTSSGGVGAATRLSPHAASPPPVPQEIATEPAVAAASAAAAAHASPAASTAVVAQPAAAPDTTVGVTAAPRLRSRSRLGFAGALVAIVAIAALGYAARRGPNAVTGAVGGTPDRVLVAEFENRTGRTDLALLGAIAQDWISARLQQSGDTTVLDGPTALRLWRGANAGDTAYAALAERERVGVLLSGSLTLDGEDVVAQARLIALPSARVLGIVGPRRSRATQPLAALDALAGDAVLSLARLRDPRLESALPPTEPMPSLPAYNEFVRGLDAYIRRDLPAASEAFVHAAELDTSLLAARVYAAATYKHWGDAGNVHVEYLLARLDRLPEQMRLRTQLMDAYRRGELGETRRIAETLQRRFPTSVEIRYSLALMQLSDWRARGAAEALDAIDPTSVWMRGWHTYWLSVGIAHHALGEHEAERVAYRRARAQYPEQLSSLAIGARLYGALGDEQALRALLDTARVLEKGAEWSWSAGNIAATAIAELDAHGHAPIAARLREWMRTWYAELPPAERAREESRFSHTYQLYLAGLWDDAERRCADAAIAEKMTVILRGTCLVLATMRGDSTAIAERTARLADAPAPDAPALARLAVARGDREAAMRHLRTARRSLNEYSIYLHVDPVLARLRADPEFATLMAPVDR